MANVVFKRGTGIRPANAVDGTLYFDEGKGRLYMGQADGSYVLFSDIEIVDSVDAATMKDGKLYFNGGKVYYLNNAKEEEIATAAALKAVKESLDSLLGTGDGDDGENKSIAEQIQEAIDKILGTTEPGEEGEEPTPANPEDQTIAGAKAYTDKAIKNIPTYRVVKLDAADVTEGAAASYKLVQVDSKNNKTDMGVVIDIPKDMVVSSGRVVTFAEGDTDVPAAGVGTYIELTLANANNAKLYIPADSLIEYVTSGSKETDDVVITISADHKVTATLSADVTTSLGKADTAMQQSDNDALYKELYGADRPGEGVEKLTLKSLNDKVTSGGTVWGSFDDAEDSND